MAHYRHAATGYDAVEKALGTVAETGFEESRLMVMLREMIVERQRLLIREENYLRGLVGLPPVRVGRAGNPTGPGTAPNATSSYTLEDIHDRLEAGTAGTQSTFTEPAAGPGTGTMHTLNEIMAQAPAADNANGAQVAEVLAGKTFWGLNVLSGEWGPQTGTLVSAPAGNPDPACWDNTNRYVDCGNGMVMDTVTNLLWLKNANCYRALNYAAANGAAAGLADGACGLTDGSAAGDWRLPTKAEWEETIARAVVLDCDLLQTATSP